MLFALDVRGALARLLETIQLTCNSHLRNSPPEVLLGKGVLKICSKFTGEHPCRSTISIKLVCNFIEITLQFGCSPVNLLHIFRTPFPKNTTEGLLLKSIEWLYDGKINFKQFIQRIKYLSN